MLRVLVTLLGLAVRPTGLGDINLGRKKNYQRRVSSETLKARCE